MQVKAEIRKKWIRYKLRVNSRKFQKVYWQTSSSHLTRKHSRCHSRDNSSSGYDNRANDRASGGSGSGGGGGDRYSSSSDSPLGRHRFRVNLSHMRYSCRSGAGAYPGPGPGPGPVDILTGEDFRPIVIVYKRNSFV